MTKLIILIGPIGSGKTYRAKQFLDNSKIYGFNIQQVNFADELRECMWDLINWRPKNDFQYDYFKKQKVMFLSEGDENTLEDYVFETDIFVATGRELLQRMGTEVIRKRYPNFWAECWSKKVKELVSNGINVVCSDLRFVNELQYALILDSNMKSNPITKEFIFCNYLSDRYDCTNNHASEKLAQKILKDGYQDGDLLDYEYLWSLAQNEELRKEQGLLNV